MFPCEISVCLDHFEPSPLTLDKRKEDLCRVEEKRKKICAA